MHLLYYLQWKPQYGLFRAEFFEIIFLNPQVGVEVESCYNGVSLQSKLLHQAGLEPAPPVDRAEMMYTYLIGSLTGSMLISEAGTSRYTSEC